MLLDVAQAGREEMKTAPWIFVAGLSVLGSTGTAQAQTRPGFELGSELFDYSYRERSEGKTIVRDDGEFIGLTGSYVETIGSGLFLRARLSTDFGRVDYEAGNERLKNVSQDIGQLELQIGRDFKLGSGTTLTPFAGLASRVLTDHSGGKVTQGGLQGYDREISYGYVPVGIAAGLPVGSNLRLNLSVQYNWVIDGVSESKFSEIDPEAPDLKLDLRDGHGIEASAMLSVPLGGDALSFGPFVRQWNLDRSESATFVEDGLSVEFFEPKNRTTEVGVRLSFGF
ncbi:MAG TPA: hypothetical protein VEZ48_02815 [Sphingomonadaceae bacterium]|nr:hypothetical protein [Sphingomonadaceae bacterium]